MVAWRVGAGIMGIFAALASVYALGYVPGSLLIDPRERQHGAAVVVRTIVGLLLSSIFFLAALLLGMPWFAGPAVGLVAAVIAYRWDALTWSRIDVTLARGDIVAWLMGAVFLSPIGVASALMASGEFAPMFIHVDTPYFLEKVYALVLSDGFPPPSLGFVGGTHTYHFGVHALAALIVHCSGLAPHHVLFVLILPILAIGILSAAVMAASRLAPALPSWIVVPMFVIPVPTLWYAFSTTIGPGLLDGLRSLDAGPILSLMDNYQTWGVTRNNGQNLAAHFITIAGMSAVVGLPFKGWRLPVFLLGTAILFKTPTGVALISQPATLRQTYWTRPVLPHVYFNLV